MEPYLLEIKQDTPGFESFIGTWICLGDVNIIFDIGPANSVGILIDSLQSMNINRLDYIILTHIHIDHAGALADLLEYFTMAKVVCHEKGIKHLVDTSKLWSGSRDTLGPIAELYGQPKPVNIDRFISHRAVDIPEMEIIETPGHAAHHLSFLYKEILFAGEAAGNYFNFNGIDYLRPATPPRLFLRKFIESVDRLIELGDRRICYAHFGDAAGSLVMLLRFKNQLIRWQEIIKSELITGHPGVIERCIERLLRNDPELAGFESLASEMQVRERNFMSNSIKGFIGFLNDD